MLPYFLLVSTQLRKYLVFDTVSIFFSVLAGIKHGIKVQKNWILAESFISRKLTFGENKCETSVSRRLSLLAGNPNTAIVYS